ncbi:MAG TPA: xanthine dehydrogenase family protein subunit M [Candidatus Limnocylindrales bacterium]|nr:xanthine dehydrogenase family protein subunit M [Candidatus Limnocylindrales bacterium]
MIPAQFDYVRPADLEETLRILTDREGEAKLLAGGYSLIPLMKLRLAQPGLLVDLRDVGGLDGITWTDDNLRIGGRVTHRQIRDDAEIERRHPLLHDAAGVIGDPQVRNRGTIGGSCAHADPSSDWPAVLCATRATVVCRSATGSREIAAREFFLDTFVTAIEPTEVLTEIWIPIPTGGSGGAYRKLERRAGDFATVGVAAQVRLADDGTIAEAGVGLTAVHDAPFAATDAETALTGARPGDEAFRAAGAAAAAQSRPGDDSHGPVDYKRAMVEEMTVRALRAAVERAMAGTGGQR